MVAPYRNHLPGRPALHGLALGLTLGLAPLPPQAAAKLASVDPDAATILHATGLQQGLAVRVGSTDGTLEAALTNGGKILVQGLALDDNALNAARAGLQAKGIYGLASVIKLIHPDYLPYATNLVNLLVADLDAVPQLSQEEALRVVRPEGTAYLKKGGVWAAKVKPMPPQMDEWTHWGHGPDANDVSNDSTIGAMQGLQWVAQVEGVWGMGPGLRLAGGRHFSTFSPWRDVVGGTGQQLMARDAFNGMLLWSLKENNGVDDLRGNNRNNLVADKDRLYGLIVDTGYARALDARTGEVKVVYVNGARFIPAPNLKMWQYQMFHVLLGPNLLQGYRDQVCLLDAATGALKWKRNLGDSSLKVVRIAVGEGKVFVLTTTGQQLNYHYGHNVAVAKSVIALDSATGAVAWTNTAVGGWQTFNFVYSNGGLLLMRALNGEWKGGDGWAIDTWPGTGNSDARGIGAVLKIKGSDGSIAFKKDLPNPGQPDFRGEVGPFRVQKGLVIPFDPDKFQGYDVNTGDLAPRLFGRNYYNWCGYNRGFPAGATGIADGVLLFADSSTRMSFISRSVCDVGMFPAYGMFYNTTTGCGCMPMVRGYTGLRASPTRWRPVADNERLESFAPAPAGSFPAFEAPDQWPTFLRDNFRSGYSPAAVAEGFRYEAELDLKAYLPQPGGMIDKEWKDNEGNVSPLTAPTVAGGKVYVAAVEAHRLFAFNVSDHNLAWSFTAGGRIVGPPTLYQGMAFFGSRDGKVYALDAATGKLIWRFTAALSDHQIVASAQLESSWPVVASPIIDPDGKLVVSAGRHNDADSGIFLYRLEPRTGALLMKRGTAPWKNSDPANQGSWDERENGTRFINDVMSSDGALLYMGNLAIHPQTLHWSNRDSWVRDKTKPFFPAEVSGFPADYPAYRIGIPKFGMQAAKSGDGLDGKHCDGWRYNLGGAADGIMANRILRQGNKLYALYGGNIDRFTLDASGAYPKDSTGRYPKADAQFKNIGKGWISAAATDGSRIFVACRSGGKGLLRVAKTDGSGFEQEIPLIAEPVENGLAIAYGKLYVSLLDGRVQIIGNGPVSIRAKSRPQVAAPTEPQVQTLAREGSGRWHGSLWSNPVLAEPSRNPAPEAHAAPIRSIAGAATAPATEEGATASAEVVAAVSAPATAAPAAQASGENAVPAENKRMKTAKPNAATDTRPAAREAGASPLRGVLREVWYGVAGESVRDLKTLEYFPREPSATGFLSALKENGGESGRYGQRLLATLTAPKTGAYTFSLSGGAGDAELYLGQGKSPVAKAGHSGMVRLQAGHTYRLEVIHLRGDAQGTLEVTWTRPGARQVSAIPDRYLAPGKP